MVADTVLKGALLGSGVVAVLGVVGLWLRGRSRRTRVSLAETATAAWEDVGTQSAQLTVAVDPDLAVSADPRKLRELFAALFENSVEYGDSDVQIRLAETDDGFAVEDDGPGVPPEDRERVFELGYSTQADRQGLGLGMVRTLCNAYGWTVEIAESEDGGTRIVISDVGFYSTWERDDVEAAASADAT